jgi:putative transposase
LHSASDAASVAFIADVRSFSGVLGEALEISSSGYHQRRQRSNAHKRPISGISNDAMLAHIGDSCTGQRRIWLAAHVENARCARCASSKERVRKLMAQHGIRTKHKRKYVTTTNSNHDLPVAPNLLERNFTTKAPNQVSTSDIT